MDTPETRRPAEPPALFGGLGLVFLLGVTLVAARLSAPWVALLAGSLLLVGLTARLWARYCLVGLTYGRWGATQDPAAPAAPGTPATQAPPLRVFCGDTLVLETRLSNRKLLPLPWVEAWERLPRALDPGGEVAESFEARDHAWFCQGASLWPYQRARWQHHLACRHRGAFTLGPVRVRTGDPFGLSERDATVPAHLEVIVYPRVVSLRHLGLPLRQPALDLASRRSLVADPTRTAWVRDYQSGDPPRLIHWPATAHQGRLQVRVLEPATTLQVNLLLDPMAFDVVLSVYRDTLFELAVSALASIAVYLNQVGYPVGLATTTRPGAAIRPSANLAQLPAILERLARVQPERPLPARLAGIGATADSAKADNGQAAALGTARLVGMDAASNGDGAGGMNYAPAAVGTRHSEQGAASSAPTGPGTQGAASSAPTAPAPWHSALGNARGSAVILATSDLALDLAETVAGLEEGGRQVVVLLATAGGRVLSMPAERVVRLLPDADLAAVLEGAAPAPSGRR
jgi:hypothetical protein